MMVKRAASALLLIASFACGSSESPPPASPAATTPPAGGEAEAHEEKQHQHHRLTPELDAFHQLLSPLWHAAKGEARRKDTCAAVADFQARASAVKSASPPAGVEPATWSTRTGELEASVSVLATACSGSDPAAFEPAFEKVHTGFHQAMELVAGEHGAHGQH